MFSQVRNEQQDLQYSFFKCARDFFTTWLTGFSLMCALCPYNRSIPKNLQLVTTSNYPCMLTHPYVLEPPRDCLASDTHNVGFREILTMVLLMLCQESYNPFATFNFDGVLGLALPSMSQGSDFSLMNRMLEA
eukprot:2964648-Amphidinium_carterae.2